MSKIKKRAESSAKKATDSAKSQNLGENISSLRDSAKQNLVKNKSREAQPLKSVVGGGGGSCEGGGGERLRNSQESLHSSPLPLPQKNARGEKWDSNADLSAQGRKEIRNSSLRKCSAQNDKLKKNAESRADSAKSQNLVKKQSHKPLKSALDSAKKTQKILDSAPKKIVDSAPRTQNALDSATYSQAQADSDALQKKIKYYFRDENLLRTALTHKSFDKHANNERLEFLGDAVMDLIIGEYVFRTQERGNEGDLTRIRAAMVNENSLANLANSIDLGKYLFISFSENRNKGRKKPSILSDAFEALMGAIYLDGGLESARAVAHNLLENEYREVEIESLFVDYKSALQELTQAICGNLPKYVLLKSSGPDHSKKFTMQVLINGEKFATARGKSKKEAEQECAKIAYNRIKKEAI